MHQYQSIFHCPMLMDISVEKNWHLTENQDTVKFLPVVMSNSEVRKGNGELRDRWSASQVVLWS